MLFFMKSGICKLIGYSKNNSNLHLKIKIKLRMARMQRGYCVKCQYMSAFLLCNENERC